MASLGMQSRQQLKILCGKEFSPWSEVFNLQTCTLWLESGRDENDLLSLSLYVHVHLNDVYTHTHLLLFY